MWLFKIVLQSKEAFRFKWLVKFCHTEFTPPKHPKEAMFAKKAFFWSDWAILGRSAWLWGLRFSGTKGAATLTSGPPKPTPAIPHGLGGLQGSGNQAHDARAAKTIPQNGSFGQL